MMENENGHLLSIDVAENTNSCLGYSANGNGGSGLKRPHPLLNEHIISFLTHRFVALTDGMISRTD